MERFIYSFLAFVLVLSLADPAAAYIGPGAGLSLVAAFWALIATIGAALGFIILYPLRRMQRRRRAARASAPEAAADARVEPGADTGPAAGRR
jgi:membrane associated rhomboid family serine protease